MTASLKILFQGSSQVKTVGEGGGGGAEGKQLPRNSFSSFQNCLAMPNATYGANPRQN